MDDNFFQAAYGGSFLNHQFLVSAAAPVYPNAPSSLQPMLDANGQLALDKNGKIIQDGNITPIGAPFQSAPGQTFDQNCAVNTIYSANLTPVNANPNSNGLLPSQNDSNPNDSTRPYIPTIGDSLDGARRRGEGVITHRKPTCDIAVSRLQLCRAEGRYREQ